MALVLLFFGLFSYTRAYIGAGARNSEQVFAATSSNLNFQGRLLSSNGNIVPDGYYNLEFKLFNASSSSGSSQGSCTGDANCLWTETRDYPGTDDRVRTVNGYFSVNLGSVTTLPNINWDQDLWLSMNVGGSGTSPDWDGEMSPKIKLTSVPFAQAAKNVYSGNTNSASTDSGNVSIQTGNATGTTSDSGNITIDVGTATGTAGTISVGTANTSGITIGHVGVLTDIAGDLTVSGSQFTNNGSTLNTALNLGNFASGGSVGSAASTVDSHTSIAIAQTTAGQVLSLPTPTDTAAGRMVFVFNTGSVSFTMHSITIPAGYGQIYVWNGSSWILGASGGGSAITLQSAYDGGNTLTTSNGRDIDVTLTDTASDANFTIDIASGSTGEFQVEANGTDILQIGSAGQLQLDVQGDDGGIVLGTDANLYRYLSGVLVTDGELNARSYQCSQYESSNQVCVGATGPGTPGAGIAFGSSNDVNLYRGGTDLLATSDAFTAAGLITGNAGLTITGGAANINTSGTAGTSIGNATGTLTLTGSNSSTIVLNGITISAAELNRLDGKDAALIDVNDAVSTAIIGTGALDAGSITSGFGSIDTGADNITTTGTITGGTVNATTGINTGAAGGTQRIDASGNLVNIGNLTTTGASTFTATGANGFTFKPGTDNTAAFLIQNAGGTPLFRADTENSDIIVENATLKTSYIDSQAGSSSTILRTNRTSASSNTGIGTASYTPGGTFTPNANRILIAYVFWESDNQPMATDGSDVTVTGGSLSWTPITGQFHRNTGWGVGHRAFYAYTTGSPPSNMQITADAGSEDVERYHVVVDEMDGVSSVAPVAGAMSDSRQSNDNNTWTDDLAATPLADDWKVLVGSLEEDLGGHIWDTPSGWTEIHSRGLTPDSTVMYDTGSTTTTLNYDLNNIDYTNADTTYGGFILKAQTTTSAINIGATTATEINIGNSGSGILLSTGSSGVTVQGSNSATAFVIQDSGASNTLFTADTNNNRILIGDGDDSSSANTTLLVLDSASTANAPSGVDGGIFYDTTLDKFRCYENGTWVNCVGASSLQGAYDGGNTITTANNKDLAVTLANSLTTDSNFRINIATGSTSEFQVEANGTDILQIGSAGQLQLDVQGNTGGIVLGTDANLYRSGADELATGGALIVNADDSDTLISLYVNGTTSPAIEVGNATDLGYVTSPGYWSDQSTAGDSVLRAGDGDLILAARNASGNILFTTGASDTVKATLTNAGQLQLPISGTSGGLRLGTDVNLYTPSSNLLRTNDALTVDGLFTGSTGANISGGIINLNASSNFATNINTGSSNGAVSIGNASAGAITLSSGAASSFTTAAGNLTLQAGSGTISLGSSTTVSNSAALAITAGAALTLQSTTSSAVSLDSGTTGAINIGTGANAKTITIGNGTGATSVVINAGTGAINIGTNAVARTITVGNATGASSVVIDCGTGACNFGTTATSHTTTVGSLNGTSSTYLQAGTGGLSIGGGGVANTLQVGSITGAITQNINIGTNNTGGSTSNVTIGSLINGTARLQSSEVYLALSGGSAIAKSLTNNTGAFQVQGTGSTPVFNVDTQNNRIGINTGSPNSTLEINSGVTNTSGLRFTQLTSASPSGGSFTNILGLDENGNVGISSVAVSLTSPALAYWDGLNNPTGSGQSYPYAAFSGNASYVGGGNGVRLTQNSGNQSGRINWSFAQVPFEHIQFQMRSGGGNGADGTWFYSYADGQPTDEYGTGMTQGYIIYFSEYHDCIGITWGGYNDGNQCNSGGGSNPLTSVAKANIDDNNWHDVDIMILYNKIVVRWDGEVVLTYDDVYTRDTSKLNFGFGARTGGSNNNHYIKGLLVTKLGSNVSEFNINNVSPLASDLYWDRANSELGIGVESPSRNLDVDGNWGGNVSTTVTANSTSTSTISTRALAYYLESQDSSNSCAQGTKTFNITGLSNTEGSYAFISSRAADTGCNSNSMTVTTQINGSTIGTVANANNGTASIENYTVVYMNGGWRIVGLNSGTAQGANGSDTADFAEWIRYAGDTQPQPGDVLSVDSAGNAVTTSSAPYDKRIIGVVSTTPYQVAGADDGHSVILALTGRVPVKVSLENGPIAPGDPLTSSSVPGVAMKATRPGKIIGTALSAYDGSQADAQVTVQLQAGFNDPYADNQSFSIDENGNVVLKNVADSDSALSVQNAAGEKVFNVNTQNGNSTFKNDIEVNGNATIQGTVYTDNVHATNGLVLDGGVGGVQINIDSNNSGGGTFSINSGLGPDLLSLTSEGFATFRGGLNSATAFQIQNASGISLFQIDTQNNRVYIGNSAPDDVGTLLVLDTKNTPGDPEGVAGAMYFNSAMSSFRCYDGTSWSNCGKLPKSGYFSDSTDDHLDDTMLNLWNSDEDYPSLTLANQNNSIIISVAIRGLSNGTDSEYNMFTIHRAIGEDPDCEDTQVGIAFGGFTNNTGAPLIVSSTFRDTPDDTGNVRYTVCHDGEEAFSSGGPGSINNDVKGITITLQESEGSN